MLAHAFASPRTATALSLSVWVAKLCFFIRKSGEDGMASVSHALTLLCFTLDHSRANIRPPGSRLEYPVRWPLSLALHPTRETYVALPSFDVMSYVIMKPLVPLNSNAFGPTR